MGYGKRALDLLTAFYQGELTNLDENKVTDEMVTDTFAEPAETDLMSEEIKPRKNLPPLLQKLEECKPERLHWLGVSYGVTLQLFNFWSKSGFLPCYTRLTPVRRS